MSILAVARKLSIPTQPTQKQIAVIACVLLIGVCTLAQSATADTGVYQKVLQSTAWVLTDQASGTAVLVDRDQGIFATNYHVIEDAKSIHLYLPKVVDGAVVSDRAFYHRQSQLKFEAKVFRPDSKRDLVLLKVASKLPNCVRQIELSTRSAQPGERVHSIGNSLSGALWIYSFGNVRQVSVRQHSSKRPFKAKVVYTQSPSNPGDSGGPIVNDQGQLLGITTGGLTTANLITYGVDVTEVQSLIEGHCASIDQRVAHALSQISARYKNLQTGAFMVAETFTDGKGYAFIDSTTYHVGPSEYRLVYAVVAGKLSAASALETYSLLNQMKVSPTGSWRIMGEGDAQSIVYMVSIPANADAKSLRAASRLVAASAILGSRHLKQTGDANDAKLANGTVKTTRNR